MSDEMSNELRAAPMGCSRSVAFRPRRPSMTKKLAVARLRADVHRIHTQGTMLNCYTRILTPTLGGPLVWQSNSRTQSTPCVPKKSLSLPSKISA